MNELIDEIHADKEELILPSECNATIVARTNPNNFGPAIEVTVNIGVVTSVDEVIYLASRLANELRRAV